MRNTVKNSSEQTKTGSDDRVKTFKGANGSKTDAKTNAKDKGNGKASNNAAEPQNSVPTFNDSDALAMLRRHFQMRSTARPR